MLPDYVQMRETRIHMDPVVNIEECSKLSGPLGNAAGLLAEGICSPPAREPLGHRLRLHGGFASSEDPGGTRRKWR